jgi:uncharacterized phage protein (TIGR01671 family)
MREIKFKCWDKDNKIMSESMDLGDYNLETHHTFYGNEGIMQFTGLLDKNGKEIYEGDLLGLTQELGQADRVFFEVFYHDGKGAFDCCRTHYQGNRCGGYIPPLNSDHLEVIGNIYENPDLLTEVK